jgi:hypothetical protein
MATDANVSCMPEESYSGGCLCGAVRYQVAGPAADPCFCHCTSCRLAAGAPMVAWATFARHGFRVTRGTLTEYRSSQEVWRGFCAACGSALTYRRAAGRDIDVTLATLDEPRALAPRMHLWVADKPPWITIGDDLPQYAGGAAAGG